MGLQIFKIKNKKNMANWICVVHSHPTVDRSCSYWPWGGRTLLPTTSSGRPAKDPIPPHAVTVTPAPFR